MTPLETVGLALLRAIHKDSRRLEALEVLYNELQAIHMERGWQFSPHASNLYGCSADAMAGNPVGLRDQFHRGVAALSAAFCDAGVSPGLATIILPQVQFERLVNAAGATPFFHGEQREQAEFRYGGFRFLVKWDPGAL